MELIDPSVDWRTTGKLRTVTFVSAGQSNALKSELPSTFSLKGELDGLMGEGVVGAGILHFLMPFSLFAKAFSKDSRLTVPPRMVEP